jgi:hypothetical protein
MSRRNVFEKHGQRIAREDARMPDAIRNVLSPPASDPVADAVCHGTASKLATLARLRGVEATITWDGAQYIANGTPCGPSVHGVYEWLGRQPGVRP